MAFHLPGTSTPVGQGMARAAAAAWTRDDTEHWLTDYPLPADFKWNGARAYPKYRLKKGYGQWLRTAGPYHAALRGLFVLCHELLAALRPGVDPMPSPEQLAALLARHAGRQGTIQLSAEDLAAPQSSNPAEDTPATPGAAGDPPPYRGSPDHTEATERDTAADDDRPF